MPHHPIERVLIANRGEIAARIARSCHKLGIEAVAVFSDADADAPFVRAADRAVRIGPPAPADSYLSIERLLDAARRSGADAVHPGYGFLSERADFAAACLKAGLRFIGPPPEAIAAMGSKIEAKARALAAGVPIVPGASGDDQDTDALAARARALGFPLLLKASAGGGGRGMRIVRADLGLEDAIEAARREALGAFGDGALMIERYIERPRHIEIQILGDAHGKVVHLFERECSIQRRHQKIIEETPSPALDARLRARMGEAAVALGRAIGYQSAGTVEFILGADGGFYFLEVNTRLQVEHPITEAITGLDLVEWQLRIAMGEPIPFDQSDLKAQGAAVECRIYAEDPDAGFLPATGRLVDWHLPDDMPGLRLDSGVEAGLQIPVHYDPMLAKLIAHGADRQEAHRRMIRALRRFSILGPTTNRAFLLRVLQHPAYQAGDLSTHFIDDHLAEPAPAPGEPLLRAAIIATLAGWADRRQRRDLLPGVEVGFRNNPFMDQSDSWRVGGRTLHVRYRNLGDGNLRLVASADDDPADTTDAGAPPEPTRARVVGWQAPTLTVELDGVIQAHRVFVEGGRCFIHDIDGAWALDAVPRFPEPGAEAVAGGCTAPMPGRVIRVAVQTGDAVAAGDVLVILEAMKMEHPVCAPRDGQIAQVLVEAGDQVEVDAVLVVIGDA